MRWILIALVAACSHIVLAANVITDWRPVIPEDGLVYERTNEGGLRLYLSGRGPRKGGDGFLWSRVPLVERGRLDFDFKTVPPGQNRAQAAFLTLYGIRVFFHDACQDWRVIYPEPNARREIGFADEPVRHERIASVLAGVWHHCRIVFDAPADRVEFFLDDMSDPAYMTASMSVWSESEFLGGMLRVGGMGGSPGGIAEFKNVILEKAEEAVRPVERTETLVFEGPVSTHYGVGEWLGDRQRTYRLDFTGSTYLPKNNYKYVRLPGAETVRKAKRVVLVDAPLSPECAIPGFLLKEIIESVKEGAELIVLGGPFSLERGGYSEGELVDILPERALAPTPFSRECKAPEIIERTVGRGRVKVLRGMNFSAVSDESRKRFLPWAEKLFR